MLSKFVRKGVEKRVTLSSTQTRVFSDSDVKITSKDSFSIQPQDQYLQFSKAPILSNFGELPFGEIPEALKYVRPYEQTTLSNGIQVATERWGSQTSSVGVYIKAGSRNENGINSGVAHLLQHLHHQGTDTRSKSELLSEFENMGTHLNSKTEREYQKYWTQVQSKDVHKAIELLGDVTSSSAYNENAVELEKQQIIDHHERRHTEEYEKTTLENVHFTSFRDHELGQPRHGDMDVVGNLNADMVRDFHKAHYNGDNMVVVATGNVTHQEIVDAVERSFGSIPKTASSEGHVAGKAVFTPSMLYIRDDEMINANVGIFYDAPGYGHQDFYAFQLLRHVFGDYSIDKNAEHLNDVRKQYNSMHAMIGDLPDVTQHHAHFIPYSDAGLFGHYFFGNEVFTRQMNYCGMCLNTIYGTYFTDVEVFRGRNSFYNQLLKNGSTPEANFEIGKQLLFEGRRVSRSEVAKRIAHMDNYHMKHLCYEWFYDGEPSITNWGAIEGVASVGSYKYFKVNTMSTVTNSHHSLYH